MRKTALITLLACLTGCAPAPLPPDTPPTFTSSISGRLTVLPDTGRRVVLEQEVNDGLSLSHFLGPITAADEFSILGDLSVAEGDKVDAFEFSVDAAHEIDLRLTFSKSGIDPPEDLDLAVHDFERMECAPKSEGEPLFAACFDSIDRNETGSFEVNGPFVVVVTSQSDTAEYQLDVTARLIEPADVTGRVRRVGRTSNSREARNAATSAASDDVVLGELLVLFRDQSNEVEEAAALNALGLRLIDRSPSGVSRVGVPLTDAKDKDLSRIETQQAMERLRRLKSVAVAEPNAIRKLHRTPNDRHFNLQWHYAAINLPQAWDMTLGSDEVVVAVIDSGIVSTHPDLQGRLVPGYDFIADADRARDGDGRDPDPDDPGDVAGGPNLSTFHGTHVAGTIGAATNNARGVAGVTWEAMIMPLRAFGRGGGTAFDSSEAIRFAAGLPNASSTTPDRRADIINMSYGGRAGRPGSQCEEAAIRDAGAAGVVLIASAGNDSTSTLSFPAALPEVISVAAVDIQSQRASYSNFGSWIDVAAPGGGAGTDIDGDGFPDAVLSTVARDIRGVIDLRYNYGVGTSMAAPHVAGVAALVLAANPELSAADVREVLMQTAVDLGPAGRDDDFGNGLIDAAAAVREARRRRGIVSESGPELIIVPETLDFGITRTELRARILNAGGGFLRVDSIDVEETEGSGWLRAQTRGSTAGNSNADEVLVTANRVGQDDGVLRGRVTVHAEGTEPAMIDVVAEVGEPLQFDEIILVTATRQGEPQITVTLETSASVDFTYEFTNLLAGDYIITAGTDRNGDGDPCGFGDLCGAFPVRIAPTSVAVGDDESVPDVDFSVSRRLLRTVITLTSVDTDASDGG